MRDHDPTHHGSTAPTISASTGDGVFAAVVAVPTAVVVALLLVQTPPALVGLAGFVFGAVLVRSHLPARAVRAVRAAVHPPDPDAEESPPATTPAR